MDRTREPTEPPTACRLKALIADDTPSNRRLLEAYLGRLGIESSSAADGREALECFGRAQPDLVLMDVMMPVMDGLEATREIRRRQQRHWVPVVLLSALSGDEHIAAGLDAGADDYLVKPVSFAVFSAKMRSVMRLLAMQRAATESLEQLRAISEAVIDGIITLDGAGIIQSCNPAAAGAFGYAPAELVGRNVAVLMPEPDASAHGAHVERYLAGGTPRIIGRTRQVTGRRADGRLFPLELGVTALSLPDRPLFVGVVRDVSERERIASERAETRQRLDRVYREQADEQQLAHELMARQIRKDWLGDPRLQHAITAASHFSGDVVLAARSPGGRTFAMLADATGHGLAAAVSVLPVISRFYAEVAREVSLGQLACTLNDLLVTTLPVGRFVGAAIACLSADASELELWVGGVPAVLLLERDGRVARCIAPEHVALGIVDGDIAAFAPVRLAVERGQQVMLYSDGLIEACAAGGEAFGTQRLETALLRSDARARVAAVQGSLAAHLDGAVQHDDISMLILTCEAPREI